MKHVSRWANKYADSHFKGNDIAIIEFDVHNPIDKANICALVAMFADNDDIFFHPNAMHVRIWAKPDHADFDLEFYQWCVRNKRDMRQVTDAFDKWHAIAYKLQDYPIVDDRYYDYSDED